MDEVTHQLHNDYAKPEDQCLECIFQKEVQEAKEKEMDARIDQAIEDQYHHHGSRR